MKERYYELNPDLKNINITPEERLEELYLTLEQAWHNISEELLAKLVESMQRRVKAIIRT